jgi:hypothetical protein
MRISNKFILMEQVIKLVVIIGLLLVILYIIFRITKNLA